MPMGELGMVGIAGLDGGNTLKWEAESPQSAGRSHGCNKDDPVSTVTERATEEAV